MSHINANTTPLGYLTGTCFHKILSSILYLLRSHTFLILVECARPGGGWSLPKKKKKIKQKLIWSSMPVGSHTSGWFICCVLPELPSLLEFHPRYKAVITTFVMRPACAETNKTHSTCITQQSLHGQAHCAICCLQPSRGVPIVLSKEKFWSGATRSNTFNLLAELSAFLKKICPFGVSP